VSLKAATSEKTGRAGCRPYFCALAVRLIIYRDVAQVRALFTVAACVPPAVIFIDEIDSILSARKAEGACAPPPLGSAEAVQHLILLHTGQL